MTYWVAAVPPACWDIPLFNCSVAPSTPTPTAKFCFTQFFCPDQVSLSLSWHFIVFSFPAFHNKVFRSCLMLLGTFLSLDGLQILLLCGHLFLKADPMSVQVHWPPCRFPLPPTMLPCSKGQKEVITFHRLPVCPKSWWPKMKTLYPWAIFPAEPPAFHRDASRIWSWIKTLQGSGYGSIKSKLNLSGSCVEWLYFITDRLS